MILPGLAERRLAGIGLLYGPLMALVMSPAQAAVILLLIVWVQYGESVWAFC